MIRLLLILAVAVGLGSFAHAADAPTESDLCRSGALCHCGDDCKCGPECGCESHESKDLPAALQLPSEPEPSVEASGYLDVEDEIAELKRRMDLHAEWARNTKDWLDKRAEGEEARIEAVVTRILGEVSVGIRSVDGSVRQQTVPVGADWQGNFTIGADESIDCFTNPITGQRVCLPQPQQMAVGGQPVEVQRTPFMELRRRGNRAAFRVKATPMMQWMSVGTCAPGGCN